MDAIKYKIHVVGDEVCFKCSQNYEGECRAYLFSHTQEEFLFRSREKLYVKS